LRRRLDVYLYEQGLFESRSLAGAAVMRGLVSVNGRTDVKCGTAMRGDEEIVVLQSPHGYVSRGGTKLEHALREFGVEVAGRIVLDVGASTGGFTECLLEHGASRVISLDVGKGQLHLRLRKDPRVTVMEGVNARYLAPGDLDCEPSLAVLDVSFISLGKVVPPVFDVLAQGSRAVALLKPQFEAGRSRVGRGGVVRDPAVHREVLVGVRDALWRDGIRTVMLTTSPLKGPKGNVEFFVLLERSEGRAVTDEEVEEVVAAAHGAATPERSGGRVG